MSDVANRRDWITSNVIRDEARLEALQQYQVLDTEPAPAFDRAARLAAHLFDAPTALINFLDEDRQYVKSAIGRETLGHATHETSLDTSLCVYALADDEVFVVEDLTADERFADNPYMIDHGCRFYAAAPLTTPGGHRLGTLCAFDTEPRSPGEDTLERLADLTTLITGELELRREQAAHEETRSELEEHREVLRQAERLAGVAGMAYNPKADAVTWTDETYRLFGLSPEADLDLETALGFCTPESRSALGAEIDRLREDGGTCELELEAVTASGERRRIRATAKAERNDGETTRIVGAAQDITEQRRDHRLTELQNQFFEWIATGVSTDKVLDRIARVAEAELPGVTVSILRRDHDRLRYAAGPSLPSRFVGAIDGAKIDPEVGPCGTAAYQNEATTTADIQEESRWDDFQEAAERAGFRACSSQVIRGRDASVLGTIATYREEPGTPTPDERGFVETMTQVASVALERDKREQALRRSENKFRTVVKHAQPVTFMMDRDGTFLLSEGKDLEALGLEPGEVVGQSVYDVYAENPSITEAVQRALDGEYVDETVQVDDLIFDCWYSPFYDDEGTVAGVIGMAVDITERRQAQRELRDQKELLQTLVDNVPVMISLVTDGEVKMANAHFESVLGWSQDEMKSGTSLLDRCYPDPAEKQRVLNVIEEVPDEWQDERPKAKDGSRVDTTWKNVALSEGRRICIGVDISERKARERELKDTNRRLRLALEAADAGTFEFDVDTGRVHLSERTMGLFGLGDDAQTIDASRFEAIILGDGFERLVELFDQTAEEGRSRYEMSYRIRRPDTGEIHHIRSRGLTLRGDDGTPERVVGISQDITERLRRKKTLERQNDLFTKAQDIASVGAWEYDVGSDEMRMTDEAYRIGELSPAADMTRERGVSFYHPDDQPIIRDAIAKAIEEGTPYDLELRLTTPEGERKWVRTRGEPQTEDGEVVRLRGTIQDITERKKRERVLRERQEKIEALYEATNQLLQAEDRDDLSARLSRLVSETLNYPATTIRLVRENQLVPTHVPSAVQDSMPERPSYDVDGNTPAARAHRSGETQAFDNLSGEMGMPNRGDIRATAYVPIGTYGLISVGSREVNGIGTFDLRLLEVLAGYAGLVLDRLDKEQALRSERDLLGRLLETSPDAIVRLDREGTFIQASGQVEAVLGASEEEILGRTFDDPEWGLGTADGAHMPEEDLPFAKIVRTGKPVQDEELSITWPDGSRRMLSVSGAPLYNESPRVQEAVFHVSDITDQKKREQALREAKDEAEEAARIKSALLSNMSHELRTPLTSIISFAEIIDRNPSAASQFADRILGGGRRLLYTLNTVMEFAELEGKSTSDDPSCCQPEDIVRSVVYDYRERAEKEGLDLGVEASGSGPFCIDADLTERVLTHLLHNAVKFTNEGEIIVSTQVSDDTLKIDVSDTGVGMDPAFVPNAFEEFAQESTGLDRTHEGNGLGLTVAKRFVDRMNGTLHIESEPGQGTTVTVVLPNARQPSY